MSNHSNANIHNENTTERTPQYSHIEERRKEYKKSFDKEEKREKREQSLNSIRKSKKYEILKKRRMKRQEKNKNVNDNDMATSSQIQSFAVRSDTRFSSIVDQTSLQDDIEEEFVYIQEKQIQEIKNLITKFQASTDIEEMCLILDDINQFIVMDDNERFVDMVFNYDIDKHIYQMLINENKSYECLFIILTFYLNMTYLDHVTIQRLLKSQDKLYNMFITLLDTKTHQSIPFDIFHITLLIIGNLISDSDNYRKTFTNEGFLEYVLDDDNFLFFASEDNIELILGIRTWLINTCFFPLVHYQESIDDENGDKLIDCSDVDVQIIQTILKKLFSWKNIESIEVRSNIVLFLKLITESGVDRTNEIYDESIIDILSEFLSGSSDQEMKENIILVFSNLCKCENDIMCERICETIIITICLKYLANYEKTRSNYLFVEILLMLSNLCDSTSRVISLLYQKNMYNILDEIFNYSGSNYKIKMEIMYIYMNTMDVSKTDLFKSIFTEDKLKQICDFCSLKNFNPYVLNIFLNNINKGLENSATKKSFQTENFYIFLNNLQETENKKVYNKVVYLLDTYYTEDAIEPENDLDDKLFSLFNTNDSTSFQF